VTLSLPCLVGEERRRREERKEEKDEEEKREWEAAKIEKE
jgi:hypothetical protein